MPQDDVVQIRVSKQSVGIIGLKATMADMAEEYAEKPDNEVGTELLKRLSERNYIPDRVNLIMQRHS